MAFAAWDVWANLPTPTHVTNVPPSPRPPPGRLPWVSTFNYRIVDDHDRYLLLRGFNQDSLVEWPAWPPAPMDEQDAILMQSAGFNVVRLPISWSLLEPQRGTVDSGYLDRIASTVDMLNRHDLYVVLDMHFSLDWGPLFGGTGAPTWATVPGWPTWTWQPPNASWKISPGIYAAHQYFWQQPDWQADFMMVWGAVAARFRDQSGVVGYDLYNEPEPFPSPPHIFEENWMWPLFARVIDAIGGVDSNHLFIVEGILFADFPTTIDGLLAPNLVYGAHIYTGALVPPDYPQAPDQLPRSIRDHDWEAKQLPAATWIGEMGIDFSKSYADQWIDAALDNLDDLGIGWAWWQWRDIPTWGIRNTDGTSLNRDKLQRFARPFLVAAPAGVTAGRGDGMHGHLSVQVQPDHVDLPVEVSWSALTLPPPVVEGTCVRSSTWRPDAARIDLLVTPGSGCAVEIHAASQPSPSG